MGLTGCPLDGPPSGKVVSTTACTREHSQPGWAAPGSPHTRPSAPWEHQDGHRLASPATHRPRETQQGWSEGGWFTFPCQQHPLGSLSGYRRQGLKSSGKVPGETERGRRYLCILMRVLAHTPLNAPACTWVCTCTAGVQECSWCVRALPCPAWGSVLEPKRVHLSPEHG